MKNSDKKTQIEVDNQNVFFTSSENMFHLKDNSIDVIVTSPPYNRNKNYSSDNEEKHDDNMPENEYLDFLIKVWRECFRVASDRSVFFLNIGDSAQDQGISEKVANTAVQAGWTRIQDIVWIKSIYGKGHYTPSGGEKRFNNIWEHIYMFVKNKKRYSLSPKSIGIPYADKSNIGRYGDTDLRDPGNVFHITYEKTTGNTIKKGHDAPYPIGLPYLCIKAVSESKTVLDPFLGTGTTLAAANNLGKIGFGYEKYPRNELIVQTIKEGKNYQHPESVLIPHFEESLDLLLDLYLEKKGHSGELKSKKDTQNFEILIDTLTKIGIKPSKIHQLIDIIKLDPKLSNKKNQDGILKFIE